jgi:hypothetical protein
VVPHETRLFESFSPLPIDSLCILQPQKPAKLHRHVFIAMSSERDRCRAPASPRLRYADQIAFFCLSAAMSAAL